MRYTIDQLVREGPVPSSLTLSLLNEILQALEASHLQGRVNGRINPESIVIVSDEGEAPRAQLLQEGSEHEDESAVPVETTSPARPVSNTGTAVGLEDIAQIAYLAPEQLEGHPATEATDVFAIGTVAYLMLTGRHPFMHPEDPTPEWLKRSILHEQPTAIEAEVLETLPQHVPQVLATALAKDPAERFSDATSFREALKSGTDGQYESQMAASSSSNSVTRRSPEKRGGGSEPIRLVAIVIPVLAVLVVAAWLVVALSEGDGSSVPTTLASESTTSTDTSDPAGMPATTTTLSPPDTSSSVTTVALTPTRVEQDDPYFSYEGDWTNSTDQGASGGTFFFADSAGASVSVSFAGTHAAWIAKRSPVYGKAEVSLDGQVLGLIDLYSPETEWQPKVWGSGTLEPGLHTVTISWTGEKSPGAEGTNICVDAFDVTGTLVQGE